jgi:hypothetical protein
MLLPMHGSVCELADAIHKDLAALPSIIEGAEEAQP